MTIAIVGQACLLPGASTPEQLWQLVQRQRSAVTAAPEGRFGIDTDLVLAAPGHAVDKMVTSRGGYVHDPRFDADGLAAIEADWQQLDPLFRWVVSTARDAVRDAGLPDQLSGKLSGKRVRAVFGNLSFPSEAMTRIGAQRAFQPNRLSTTTEEWNLRMSGGPALLLKQAMALDHAVALDAACASSLYAMHLGCQWLREQRCDVVLAGAVNRADRLFLHVGFTALQALSPSGRSQPFSASADGLLPAEGCAFIAMMRLEDAIAQGKRILAVVRGSALSNDGRQRNLLTPSTEGQVRAIQAAWAQADINPSCCQYVECHATGTQAGDATEVTSMATALAHGRSIALPVSSLKANMGHLITVAGMAGVVKTIAGMQAGELPTAMPVSDVLPIMEQQRLRLSGAHEPWPAVDSVRIAGVSAFGFGGNNAHVVLASSAVASTRVAVPAMPLVCVAIGAMKNGHRGEFALLHDAKPVDVVIDADGLRFPPNDLRDSIQQHTQVFSAAADAIAQLPADALPTMSTGVFIGMGTDVVVTTPGLRWRAPMWAGDGNAASLRDAAMPVMSAQQVLGCMPNIPANRLNVHGDWRGASFTVSSEQDAGIDASEAAMSLLRAGELDAAIVGVTAVHSDKRWPTAMRGDDEAAVAIIMTAARADELGLPSLCSWPPPRTPVATGTPSAARHFIDDLIRARIHNTPMSHEASLCLFAAADASSLAAVQAASPPPGVSQQGRGSVREALVATDDQSLRDAWRARRYITSKATITEPSKWAYCYGPSTPTESRSLQPLLAMVGREALSLPIDAVDIDAIQASGSSCVDNLGHATLRMQVLSRFLQHVAGVKVGAAIGVSLGESNALLAHDVWRDWQSLRAETMASPLFASSLGEGQSVLRAALSEPHRSVVVSCSVLDVKSALAAHGRGRAWMTLIHHDNAVELGGATSAISAVVTAFGVAAMELPHAPTVHNPHIAAVANDYRILHHRAAHPSTMTIYSAGVGSDGGVLRQDSDSIADALLQQATRTVDVPALLRRAWSDGIRGFIDVSPRGMMAQWIRATLPDAVVVAVDDGDAVHGVLRACAQLHVAGVDIDTDRIARCSRRVPSHRRPMTIPARGVPTMPIVSVAAAVAVEAMPPPPLLPAVLPVAVAPARRAAPVVAAMPASRPAPIAAAPVSTTIVAMPAPMPASMPAPAPMNAASWVMNQRAHIDASHNAYLHNMAQAHAAYLNIQARTVPPPVTKPVVVAPVVATVKVHTPPIPTPAPQVSAPPSVWLNRQQLVSLATDPISKVLGPKFQQQDAFHRQVRMPRPPLLLACRVMSTTATATELEPNHHLVTETDVRPEAWYLHEGRVPAGVLIETGQADLLLISYMGVDFDNRGARVYRLLGCDLTYTAHLPQVGDVLHHDIVIDGFANHGDTRIFFFHSDTRIGGPTGPICLQVRNGQAGFFSDDELAGSGGVLWSAHEEKPDRVAAIKQLAHASMPRFTHHRSLARSQLEAFADARPWDAFGDSFAITKTQVAPPRIDPPRQPHDDYGNPDGRFIDMLLLDRVTHLEPGGGPWGRGYVRAELDITPTKWFFDGHFQDDPCMPGTIMFQGCLQLASTFIAASGFTLARDGFRFEPKLGHAMPLRCRSQCTPSSKHLVYELFVQSITGGEDPAAPCELRADILVTVDGLKSLYAKDVTVALVPDAPLSALPSLRGVTAKPNGVDGVSPTSIRHPTAKQGVTGFQSVMSTGIGRPSDAFPGLYEPFDSGRPVARMPGPPYHFMSRVDDVQGSMGSLARQQPAPGIQCRVAYDVPPDAWYFAATQDTQGGAMPFAVLLEVALQPCGWLSSYVGSALTSSSSLSYRNLDGQGTQHRRVDANIGTLLTTAVLRKSSSSGGMIIQEFSFAMTTADGEPVFDGTTVFGFFPPEALANQVGLPVTDVERATRSPMTMTTCDIITPGLPAPPTTPRGLSLRVIDDVAVSDGPSIVGQRVRSRKRVQLDDWFFRAHFFRDPVQPGSLGIEAMIQALSWWMHQAKLVAPGHCIESLARGAPLSWKYRGQVTPQQRDIEVDLVITEVVEQGACVRVKADASLWVDGKKIYRADGLALATVPLSQTDA